jgi:hypothetical protein
MSWVQETGLNDFDLLLDQLQPLEQSLELSARIRWQQLIFRGAQLSKVATGCRCVWVDVVQPVQRQQ